MSENEKELIKIIREYEDPTYALEVAIKLIFEF